MLNLSTESDVAQGLNVISASVRRWLEERGPPFLKVRTIMRYRRQDLAPWSEHRNRELAAGGAQ